ncbi:MAG: hypothetical protein F6K24_30610, partial [Okeania sp. SIO2D1]|nr:hypothetical protein [Okeania sp. SIO2D1]
MSSITVLGYDASSAQAFNPAPITEFPTVTEFDFRLGGPGTNVDLTEIIPSLPSEGIVGSIKLGPIPDGPVAQAVRTFD